MGWLAAIVVGGIAGWLAEKIMRSDMGLFMNILLGIVGAIVANFLLSLANIQGYDPSDKWSWSYLLVSLVGACLLIFIFRLIRGRRA
ncbi:GlsB/YeaQ/YmgE family stress response membrane protein [Mangrovicella endophytica]|uniref:GlsB/YeaQ/YmgE family stress response membrane protein n=1 Tax=Mangrovicella endophytica TaxID=2066697 RepID=UPI000C9DE20C|nr:GlsB/YeaQ/YmgE family stress response membrane protein [Mangrovicella endophytica]